MGEGGGGGGGGGVMGGGRERGRVDGGRWRVGVGGLRRGSQEGHELWLVAQSNCPSLSVCLSVSLPPGWLVIMDVSFDCMVEQRSNQVCF